MQGDRFRIGRRPDGFDGATNQFAEIDRRDVEAQVAGRHRRELEELLDNLHLRGGIALDGVENRCRSIRWNGAAPQDPRPAEHRVQRRAQLVRQHRQEFVLHAAGLFEIANQLRAFFGERALVILELPACGDIHHRARRKPRLAVIVEDDASAILQPPHLTVRADDAVFDAVFAARGDCVVDRGHHACVIVWMNMREAGIVQRALGFDRIETENAVQAFVVRGDAGLEVNVPGAHACGPERVPQSVPGEKDVLRRHGRLSLMHSRCLSGVRPS